MVRRNIQLSKLPDVDEIDRAKIDSILEACYDKIQIRVNNVVLLRAHFKEYEQSGLRKKHEVQMHLSFPGLELASHATNWNLITALQQAVSKLVREESKKIEK